MHSDLRNALGEWSKDGDLPEPSRLGYRLRAAKDKVAGGWILRSSTGRTGVAQWWVEAAADRSAGDAGDCRGSFPPYAGAGRREIYQEGKHPLHTLHPQQQMAWTCLRLVMRRFSRPLLGQPIRTDGPTRDSDEQPT